MRTTQNELTRRVSSDAAFAFTVPAKVPTKPRTLSGFTLVELMVVITIIALLASMSVVIVGQVQHTSRVHNTEVRIARLDHIMTELYESYIYRRMPSTSRNPADAARVRWLMICDTMRMEMPTNWVEALSPQRVDGLSDSPLRLVYQHAFEDAGGVFTLSNGVAAIVDSEGNNKAILLHEQAKLLYLIIMNAVPEARDMVGEKGIETDESGLSYFVDAWGNPIYFLRWAPGFSGSDRQPDLWKLTDTKPDKSDNVDEWNKISPDVLKDDYFDEYSKKDKKEAISDLLADYDAKNTIQWQDDITKKDPFFFSKHRMIFKALLDYPDPLDPVKARNITASNSNTRRPGFLLIPLIYSAGADGEPGIAVDNTSLTIDPFAQGYGAPEKNDGYHFDNIHNHTIGGR